VVAKPRLHFAAVVVAVCGCLVNRYRVIKLPMLLEFSLQNDRKSVEGKSLKSLTPAGSDSLLGWTRSLRTVNFELKEPGS